MGHSRAWRQLLPGRRCCPQSCQIQTCRLQGKRPGCQYPDRWAAIGSLHLMWHAITRSGRGHPYALLTLIADGERWKLDFDAVVTPVHGSLGSSDSVLHDGPERGRLVHHATGRRLPCSLDICGRGRCTHSDASLPQLQGCLWAF